MDLDIIRSNYKNMPDRVLIQKLTEEARGLTPEAIQVIKEELSRRNLGVDLEPVIDSQNKKYSMDELNSLCRMIEGLECPGCKQRPVPLTAIHVMQVVSPLILTYSTKRLVVGCPSCVRSDLYYDLGLSLFLGWWGFPHGPFKTSQAIGNFFTARSLLKVDGPNDLLRGFVLANIGLFTLHKHNEVALTTMIRNLRNQKPLTLGI